MVRQACRGRVLWTAVVAPEALLARITTQRPGENEYVVDTFGLAISEDRVSDL